MYKEIVARLKSWYTPRIEPDMMPIAELINWAIGEYLLQDGFSGKAIMKMRLKCWRGLSGTWDSRIQYYLGWLAGFIQNRRGCDFDTAMAEVKESVKKGLKIKEMMDAEKDRETPNKSS